MMAPCTSLARDESGCPPDGADATARDQGPSSVFGLRAGRLLVRFSWFLVPSFLQGRGQLRPATLRPTAYLDGMRGAGAVVVSFGHYTTMTYNTHRGWGSDDNYYNVIRLPILRLVHGGGAAVALFFVISGYALAYKPMQYIRKGDLDNFSTALSSMAFRRAIRLYLPTMILTVSLACIIQTGIYDWGRRVPENTPCFSHLPYRPVALPSLSAQVGIWVPAFAGSFVLFDWEWYRGLSYYGTGQLWTIPAEFRCSFYLFLIILATARLKTIYRFLTIVGIMWISYINSRWELVAFLSGVLLVEWDLLRGAHVATPTREKEGDSPQSTLGDVFWHLFAILGLFLMSQPEDGGITTPGWVFLTSLIPEWWADKQQRYWQTPGAVIFLLAVGHSRWWQGVFNSRFAQYLGKISYSLYLVHATVDGLFGYHFKSWAWDLTGLEGNAYHLGYAMALMLSLPVVVFFSDVFWRAVDIPSVNFARWYESKLVVKAD
ncbi:acyltransferase 3 [Ilyonectria sp. MPI-CAGE-AT-0026]|nr:acyltransferase 3 [Ilyonectria sp. MPI-CAGE-AT-0026]